MDIGRSMANGATVVDMRNMAEFAKGYATGSINIPLDRPLQNLSRIPKGKPVVTCCASGTRSAIAATLLGDHTYDAYNGGPWIKVRAALTARPLRRSAYAASAGNGMPMTIQLDRRRTRRMVVRENELPTDNAFGETAVGPVLTMWSLGIQVQVANHNGAAPHLSVLATTTGGGSCVGVLQHE